MRAGDFRIVPPSPPDIAAWEELLVRVELGPRAIRIALDGVTDGWATVAQDPDGWSVGVHLGHLANREAVAGAWLSAMREGEPLPLEDDRAAPTPLTETLSVGVAAAGEAGGGRGAADDGDSVAGALRVYTERRARNFAMVQRRGLEVWEWRAEHPELGSVSPYRLFCHLAAHDVRHLARIRAALRTSARC